MLITEGGDAIGGIVPDDAGTTVVTAPDGDIVVVITPDGDTTVVLEPTDLEFHTWGCPLWNRVSTS